MRWFYQGFCVQLARYKLYRGTRVAQGFIEAYVYSSGSGGEAVEDERELGQMRRKIAEMKSEN